MTDWKLLFIVAAAAGVGALLRVPAFFIDRWLSKYKGWRTKVVLHSNTTLEDEGSRVVELHTTDTLIVEPDGEEDSITLRWVDGDSYTLYFHDKEAQDE